MSKKGEKRFSNKVFIKNRKASHEYELLEKYEAGIMLKGTEIKSLREGKASLQEAYCFVQGSDIYIKGMNISPYSQASFESHDRTRNRKLLLHKKEIEKLKSKSEEKSLSIVPICVYTNDRGLAKMEIALARGKKIFDKRESIKNKDQKRDLDRATL